MMQFKRKRKRRAFSYLRCSHYWVAEGEGLKEKKDRVGGGNKKYPTMIRRMEKESTFATLIFPGKHKEYMCKYV